MLLVKGTHEGHARDSHYLLHVILDYLHKDLFYMHVTSKGHAVSSPTSCIVSEMWIPAKDTKGNVLAVDFTEIISTLECFGYTDEWVTHSSV